MRLGARVSTKASSMAGKMVFSTTVLLVPPVTVRSYLNATSTAMPLSMPRSPLAGVTVQPGMGAGTMDDGVIEGASNIDDGVVEGVSDTDGEVTEGANATDDGAVEGSTDMDGEFIEGASDMEDGTAEGAYDPDGEVADEEGDIDGGAVEGAYDPDGEVAEGTNDTDDGAVEGANDEAMVADPKLLTDKMAELMVLVELEGMGSKRPVLISPAMAERNDNST